MDESIIRKLRCQSEAVWPQEAAILQAHGGPARWAPAHGVPARWAAHLVAED